MVKPMYINETKVIIFMLQGGPCNGRSVALKLTYQSPRRIRLIDKKAGQPVVHVYVVWPGHVAVYDHSS